jgi:hypothetical protein
MNDPQPFPVWIFALFPVFFAAVWLFVVGLLASMGGWSELARHYRDPGEAPRGNAVVLSGASVSLRRGWIPLPANYNHCVTLSLSGTGLHLRVMAVFRFRHPPLLIPWTQVERVEPGTVLFFRILTVHPRGTSTHIHLYGRASTAVEEAWGRRAAGAAQPAPA